MNKFYVFLILLVLAILGGTVLFFYTWHKPRTGIEKVSAEIVVPTTQLAAEFYTDSAIAHQKYNKKVISISGRIDHEEKDNIGNSHFIFKEDQVEIQCAFDTMYRKQAEEINVDDSLKLKCRYVGYVIDDIFGLQIKLKDCLRDY